MNAFAFERTAGIAQPRISARAPGLSRAFWPALPPTLTAGWWLTLLGVFTAGGRQPLAVESLRASTIALPLVLLAIWAALALCERLCSAAGAGARLHTAVTIAFSALATAAAFGAVGPVLAATIGSDE